VKTKLLILLFGLIPALVMAQANGPVGSPALQGGSQSTQIAEKVRQAGASVVQDMRQTTSSIRQAQTTNSVSQQLPVRSLQAEEAAEFNSGHIQNNVPTGAAYGAVGSGPQPPIPPSSLSPGSPMPASEKPASRSAIPSGSRDGMTQSQANSAISAKPLGEEGDPDRPVVMGSLFADKLLPISEQPSPPFGVQPSQKVSGPTADGDKDGDRNIAIEDWNH